MSAGFHRLRRAHFKKKNTNDQSTPDVEATVLFEKISAKGRNRKPQKPFADDGSTWIAKERKRIFMEEIRRRSKGRGVNG